MSFPSLPERIVNYVTSRKIWAAAGKPIRPIEAIKYIFQTHCKECEHYKSTGYACDICGCYINENNDWNKIAWSTTHCPMEPPKWTEEEPYQNQSKSIPISAEELRDVPPEAIPQEPSNLPPTPPEKKPGGCGC